MPYKYLEGITQADVAFEASGKTLEEMFEAAAVATTGTMIRDPKKVEQKVTKQVKKEAENVEKLLYDFLEEIIFLKDAEQLFLSGFKVSISGEEGKYSLEAEMSGEEINPEKHEIVVDAKAITMHKFEVKKEGDEWKAIVVIDV